VTVQDGVELTGSGQAFCHDNQPAVFPPSDLPPLLCGGQPSSQQEAELRRAVRRHEDHGKTVIAGRVMRVLYATLMCGLYIPMECLAAMSRSLQPLVSRVGRRPRGARAISSIQDAQQPNDATLRHTLSVVADNRSVKIAWTIRLAALVTAADKDGGRPSNCILSRWSPGCAFSSEPVYP
jgi:hypothetical protein